MEEIPKTYKGKALIGVYKNFALYIDPQTKIRECFLYQELMPPKKIELTKPTFNFNIKYKKRRKRI